ncbi:MAG: hypothetical protein WA672_00880 [Candidatus Angelobacter sp.]
MAHLIVLEKIDGNPVAWRCSDCSQSFSARGKLTTQERHKKITSAFKAHMEESHKADASVGPTSIRQPLHQKETAFRAIKTYDEVDANSS